MNGRMFRLIALKCFHGTSIENGESILKEQRFRQSDNDKLRMGVGAYFFCQAGCDDEYPKMCARELEKYHLREGKHKGGYMILSCTVECEDDKYLDLYEPDSLEFFHRMRYILLERSLRVDPNFKYRNNAIADTQVFDEIRNIRRLDVIRCPQYFGMFEKERRMNFEDPPRFPKSFVPNVIVVCANIENADIKNITEIERGIQYNGYETIV